MKFILKKDLKYMLPSFAMFVIAGLAMVFITGFGWVTKNGNFTVTALYIFYFLTLAVTGITIFRGANLFRKNLGDTNYLGNIRAEGISERNFIIYKIFLSFIAAEALYIWYSLLFGVSKLVSDKVLSDISDELAGQRFVPQGDMLLTTVSGLFVVLGLTILFFTTFGLNFRYFLRGRYALLGAVMTTFTGFWVVWKIYDMLVPVKGVLALVGTVIYVALGGALLLMLTIKVCGKKLYEF